MVRSAFVDAVMCMFYAIVLSFAAARDCVVERAAAELEVLHRF